MEVKSENVGWARTSSELIRSSSRSGVSPGVAPPLVDPRTEPRTDTPGVGVAMGLGVAEAIRCGVMPEKSEAWRLTFSSPASGVCCWVSLMRFWASVSTTSLSPWGVRMGVRMGVGPLAAPA